MKPRHFESNNNKVRHFSLLLRVRDNVQAFVNLVSRDKARIIVGIMTVGIYESVYRFGAETNGVTLLVLLTLNGNQGY